MYTVANDAQTLCRQFINF